MDYKSKYLKYKLKYLNQKKLLGGMEANPDVEPQKKEITEATQNEFYKKYFRTIPNSLKVYAYSFNMFNYKNPQKIKDKLQDVKENWEDYKAEIVAEHPELNEELQNHDQNDDSDLIDLTIKYLQMHIEQEFNDADVAVQERLVEEFDVDDSSDSDSSKINK